MKRSALRLIPLSFMLMMSGQTSVHAAAKQVSPNSGLASSPTTVSGTVEDWTYRCIFPAGSLNTPPSMCTVEQRLFREDADKKNVSIGGIVLAKATPDPVKTPIAGRPWRLTLMTPLGLSLSKPSRLVVDDHTPLNLAWQSCIQTGCLSVLELTDQQSRILRRGKQGHMQIDKLLDGVLTINFALQGLDDALTAAETLMSRPLSH